MVANIRVSSIKVASVFQIANGQNQYLVRQQVQLLIFFLCYNRVSLDSQAALAELVIRESQ